MKIGIPVLDELLGDVPRGKTVTYLIDPEVEGDVFPLQTLYENLENGNSCALIVSSMSPEIIKNRFREFGWDIEKDSFSIVDAYSAYVGASSEEKYFVKNPADLKELDRVITRAIEENDLIVFNSLSTIIDISGEDVIEFVNGWNKYAMLNDAVIVYGFTSWPYAQEVLEKIKELSNTVISVGGIHHRVVLGHYYGILKSDWKEVKNKAVLFKLLRPGGVRAYIPKILVTGPFNSGKTTFVHSISTKAVSVDRLGTTVALDHGHVDYKGFSIDIFGTPGQERFNPVLKILGGEALGVIVVVDSTKPEDFPRAKEMLAETTRFGLPYVIAANKQDIDGCLSPEEIKRKMNLPDDAVVVPMSARSKEGVYDVLDALLNLLIGG
jgi:hypothetical protein